jgi:hypothetical protein
MAGWITAKQAAAIRPLLAFIYKGEGNYTSVNRGKAGDTPGGDPKLVSLSLQQVKEAQAQGAYFAVGAAQFIPATLKLAQVDAGVGDQELFNPENQDRLAAALILGSKRPNLAAFVRGQRGQAKASLDDAQTDLACEWASIPLPNGRGAYDGDQAGNCANQSVKAVRDALLAAQKAFANLDEDAPSITNVEPSQKILTITALQDTWLKKEPLQAADLPVKDREMIKKGTVFNVLNVTEVPRDAHVKVELANGKGTWYLWQPHWLGFVSASKASYVWKGLIDWRDFGFLVTPHITVGEVLNFDVRRIPSATTGDIGRIINTAREMEKVRVAWGGPLGFSSFYRPEPINTEVGGVVGSQHIAGNAADVFPLDRSLEEFYEWIRVRWTGGVGDGRNKGFIHLDTRQGGGFVPGAGRRPCAEWLY